MQSKVIIMDSHAKEDKIQVAAVAKAWSIEL